MLKVKVVLLNQEWCIWIKKISWKSHSQHRWHWTYWQVITWNILAIRCSLEALPHNCRFLKKNHDFCFVGFMSFQCSILTNNAFFKICKEQFPPFQLQRATPNDAFPNKGRKTEILERRTTGSLQNFKLHCFARWTYSEQSQVRCSYRQQNLTVEQQYRFCEALLAWQLCRCGRSSTLLAVALQLEFKTLLIRLQLMLAMKISPILGTTTS